MEDGQNECSPAAAAPIKKRKAGDFIMLDYRDECLGKSRTIDLKGLP
jgi:hypothetical protein